MINLQLHGIVKFAEEKLWLWYLKFVCYVSFQLC